MGLGEVSVVVDCVLSCRSICKLTVRRLTWTSDGL